MKPTISKIIKSTEATDQRDAYLVKVHINDVDMTSSQTAFREARRLSFAALDAKVGPRAWFTSQRFSSGATYIITTFEPMTKPIRIPSRGR